MREIKFRAWDKDEKKMLYSSEKDHTFEYKPRHGKHFNHPRIIPMQYTGLKDKNGMEIWEGDVLQREGYKYKHIVKWYKESAGFHMAWVHDSLNAGLAIEIIGNIYENPELMFREEAR